MRTAVLLALALCLLTVSAHADTGVVTASALVLRAGPGTQYAPIGEIPYGARLEMVRYEDGWYYVAYGLQAGYVLGRYVRVELPSGQTAAPTSAFSYATPAPTPSVVPPPAYAYATATPSPTSGLALPELTFDGENNPNYPRVLKPGDSGNSVLDLQVTLQGLGYTVSADGDYGYDTQAAVMRLQRSLGIEADGIVGDMTRRRIGGGGDGEVELLDWWLGGNVAVARLNEATVVDVRTGRSFQISRYGGDSHCDAEPLTSRDTAEMLDICGGEWTWDRRPIWLEVNGRVIAASMNAMPHEGQHIQDNDFDGHFCIHFYNSRTHDTNRVDEEHAACVMEAWNNRDLY